MKLNKVIAASLVCLSLAGCADHPVLSAVAGAALAGGVAVAAANHDKHHHDRGTAEGWYDENGNFHRYQADEPVRHKHHHHSDESVDDRPNWER